MIELESCDDGNGLDDDGCSASCVIEPGWSCTGSPSLCRSCGNGVVETGEFCDDGNTAAGDGCSTSCNVEFGFSCDDQAPSVCQSCGNGRPEGSETCDDGNRIGGDGCSGFCSVEDGWTCTRLDGARSMCASCGNGVLESGETCDDANRVAEDGCSAACEIESGWQCAGEPSLCAFCGNGLIELDETCDDGNSASRDGCSSACQIETGFECIGVPSVCSNCGNGIIEPSETCDDGNAVDDDGCSSLCAIEADWTCTGAPSACNNCGNGVLERNEACDDGNRVDGDGCRADCIVTPGFICAGDAPSVCSREASARVVSAVFPTCGASSGGTVITMSGALLHADVGAPSCRFGGSTSVVANQTTLRDGRDVLLCRVPPLAIRTRATATTDFDFELVWVDGFPVAFESLTATFTAYSSFSIDQVAPETAKTAGGETISLIGGPFANDTTLPTLTVSVGGLLVEAVAVSETVAIFSSPPHLAQTNLPIRVSQNFEADSVLALSADAGDWTVASDTLTYEPCGPGYWSEDELSACIACEPGTFSEGPDARSCTACPVDQFQPASASSSCITCPPSTLTLVRRETLYDCVCGPNTYNASRVHMDGCSGCPDGAECLGSDIRPRALPGFWTAAPDASDAVFVACSPPEACTGGVASACADGYTGNKCGSCADGFFRSSNVCKPCAPHSPYMALLFAIVVVVVAGLAFKYAGKHRSSIMTPVGLLIDYLQITAMVLSMEAGWPQSAKDSVSYLTSGPALNMDFLAAECSVQATYGTKLAASLLLPVVFGVLLCVIYVVRAKVMRRRQGMRKLTSSVLMLLGLVYMSLTTTSLSHFDCTRQVDGSLTMDAAPSIDCFSDEWYRLLPAAVAGIVFYVVGIPLLLLVVYTRFRFRMREAAIALSIGGEFEAFRPRYAFWAPLLMLRKLALVLAKIFFTSITAVQLVAAMMIIVVSIMMQLKWQPYADEKMNTLETIFLASSAFVLSLGTMLQTATFVGTEAVNGIGWTVFVVVLLNTLLVVAWLLWELAYQLRLRHTAVGSKEQQELLYNLFAAERIHPVHEYAIHCEMNGDAEAFFSMLGQIEEVAMRFDRQRTPVSHNSPSLALLTEFTLRAFHTYHIGAVAHWLMHEAAPADVDRFRSAFETMARRTYAVNERSLRKRVSRLLSTPPRPTEDVAGEGKDGTEFQRMADLVIAPSTNLEDLLLATCRQARFTTTNVVGRATSLTATRPGGKSRKTAAFDAAALGMRHSSTASASVADEIHLAEGLMHIAATERMTNSDVLFSSSSSESDFWSD